MPVAELKTMVREKRDDIAVKIDARVYRKAKLIAAYRGITLAKFLTELLDKPVDREFQKFRHEVGEGEGAE